MTAEVSLAQLAETAIVHYKPPLCEHGHEMVRDAVFAGRRCTGRVEFTCPVCKRLAKVSPHHRGVILRRIAAAK